MTGSRHRLAMRSIKATGAVAALWMAVVFTASLTAPRLPAFAAPPDDVKMVPFKGSISGTLERTGLHGGGALETDWSVKVTGSGQATQLGRVDFVITNDDVRLVDPTHLGPTDAPASGQFTGPNGDKLLGVYHWNAGPTLLPGVLSYSGTFEIVGGEGRFSGATGGGTLTGTGNVITDRIDVSFNGKVSQPHAP